MKLAREGRALLFLGAGFSCGTPNAAGGSMMSGRDFSNHLAAAVGLPPGTGLMDSSEAYQEAFGDAALLKELVNEFTATGILPHQGAMADVSWKQIYTTNYDDVVEKAFKDKKISICSLNPDDQPSKVPHGEPVCIHLNGSIRELTTAKLHDQIRLTDSSYLTSALSDSEWAVRFRQDVDAAQAIFFVGYSVYDIDIARLLFAKSALRAKSFFAVGGSSDPILKRRIEKFGSDTQLSASDFFEELSKDAYAPSGPTSPPEYCVRTYVPQPAKEFQDRDVFDLFMVGRFSEDLAFDSATGKIKYLAYRKAIKKLVENIELAPSAVAVHASLGNGKTMLMEMAKIEASSAGFTVVELVRQRESLFEELDFLLGKGGKILLVIDNYGDWQEALRYIGNHNNKNISVLLAARTYTNDVLAERVEGFLKLGELQELQVEKLYDEDLLRIAQLMDAYGLWGDRASLKLHQKEQFLTTVCSREWRSILIELFKAPQIRDRLTPLIRAIQNEKNYSLILIAILILAIIDHPATTDTLTDLCGERTLTIGFRQNLTIRELIDFEADEVHLKSAVTGSFILKQVAEPDVVLKSLVSITRAADQASFASREYQSIFGALVRFGNAQHFFPDDSGNSMVLKFYESIKEFAHCKRSPLFWLQFAIAALLANDYERAGLYFASAYSFAEQSNFRTFQIDNHYARFLLLRSIKTDNPMAAMDDFRSARRLIFEQMQRERLHYPYRVAALIADWYESFWDRIVADSRDEVKRAAAFIAARITELPEHRQQHRDVVHCPSTHEGYPGTLSRLRPVKLQLNPLHACCPCSTDCLLVRLVAVTLGWGGGSGFCLVNGGWWGWQGSACGVRR